MIKTDKPLIIYNSEFLDPLTNFEKKMYQTIGSFIFYFLHILKIIQGFPWYLIGQQIFLNECTLCPTDIEQQYNSDGSIYKPICYFIVFWHFGCFINVSIVGGYYIFRNVSNNTIHDNNEFSLSVGYIVWWGSLLLLSTFLYYKSIQFKQQAEKRDAIIDAHFFRVLGIKSAVQVNRCISSPIWLLISFIPAIIVGFMVSYFYSRAFVISCDYDVHSGDFCNEIACCNILEHQIYDFYTFFAFFSANILGSYKLLELSAKYIFYSNLAWEETNINSLKQIKTLELLGEKCIEKINTELMYKEDMRTIP